MNSSSIFHLLETRSILSIIRLFQIFATTPGLIHTGAHIAVGAVMFLVIVAHLYQKGELFQQLWEKLD